jgi:myo-inositol-1(or 4)-monophosphatase
MINLDPLLKTLPEYIHAALNPFTQSRPASSTIITKEDASKTTSFDLELQEKLQELLVRLFPSFSAWGEESFIQNCKLEDQDINQGIHWVIDPIDGTTNFIHNIPAFCTTLSLIAEGEVIAGVTYDPNRKELFHTIKSQGAFFNHEKIPHKQGPVELKESIASVDFKRLGTNLRSHIAQQQPYYSQRNFGSSGIEWSWLSINRVDIYLHGSQSLWDYAGGLLAIRELGGVASDLNGNPIDKLSLEKTSILASQSASLHQEWLKIIRTANKK